MVKRVTHIKRVMTEEQVAYAIDRLTRAYGRPPTLLPDDPARRYIRWIRGREWRTLAVIDRQDPTDHYVALFAMGDQPEREQLLAFEIAKDLRQHGIACEMLIA